MSVTRRLASVLIPLATLVGCDHVTKYAAKTELQSQPPHELISSVLELRYVENTDMAFSLLRWIPEAVRRPLLLGFGAVAILGLLALLVHRAKTLTERAAMLLILGGALGNYLDRLARGYVVDFIHVRYWPVFNAADIWLSAGLVLMLWSSLRASRPPQPA